jgi:hypothetical protein
MPIDVTSALDVKEFCDPKTCPARAEMCSYTLFSVVRTSGLSTTLLY